MIKLEGCKIIDTEYWEADILMHRIQVSYGKWKEVSSFGYEHFYFEGENWEMKVARMTANAFNELIISMRADLRILGELLAP